MTIFLDGSNLSTTGLLNSMTAQNASGTSVNFTDIPVGVKRVTAAFQYISTNGSSLPRFQLGSGGSFTTSGYITVTGYAGSSAGATSSSGGWDFYGDAGAGAYRTGQIVFTLIGSNLWVGTGMFMDETAVAYMWTMSGRVTLPGTLDRVRLTTVNGTDTFDAGSINVLYE